MARLAITIRLILAAMLFLTAGAKAEFLLRGYAIPVEAVLPYSLAAAAEAALAVLIAWKRTSVPAATTAMSAFIGAGILSLFLFPAGARCNCLGRLELARTSALIACGLIVVLCGLVLATTSDTHAVRSSK